MATLSTFGSKIFHWLNQCLPHPHIKNIHLQLFTNCFPPLNSGLLDRDEIIREYLKVCVDYDNTVLNTKYAIELLYSMNGKSIFRTDIREAYEKAQLLEDLW